ncbi:MAG: DUF87 domain-containing protein [Candidatus Paceibacterota bacterium]|jgi:hypothetical protein
MIQTIITSIILAAAIIFLSVFSMRVKTRKNILQSLEMVLFSIRIPKHEKKIEGQAATEAKNLIGMMEQIFSSFISLKPNKNLKGPARIVFEIASQQGGSDIEFFVAVPKFLETGIEKQIQGIYAGAVVEKVLEDYTIFEPDSVSTGSYLKLNEDAFLPINTYSDLQQDPLAGITNALSKIVIEEGAAVQLVLKPFNYQKFRSQGTKLISLLREGKKFKTALAEAKKSAGLKLAEEAFSGVAGTGKTSKEKQQEDNKKQYGVDETAVEVIGKKIKKPLFESNIRLVVSAKTAERAEEILSHLESSFGQLASSNSFKSVKIRPRQLHNFIHNFSFRDFSEAEKNILNIEELSSIYHFPTPYLETPNIKWIKSTYAPPPVELPQSGEMLLGKIVFRGEEKPVYFHSVDDRRRHFYVVGQTGTGKSSLLREMIRQDIESGKGVAVIDPHGDLIEDTLANIPKNRLEDVVLFEPFNMERPIGLNMLEYDSPEQKDFAVQEMISIFQKLFPPEIIGPMFEHYMRNAMLALMADKNNPGTLVEVPRIFTDAEFMEERLSHVTDPIVRSFWEKEWKQTTGQSKSEMLGYVVSKVGRFIENEMMRNIIGQSHSGFDLAEVMNNGKIFLANLSKGQTGEVNSSLLGLILVSKMQMAAMRRANLPQEERKDFYLYVDEFQNFTTDSIVTILSEARKYKLNLILAHQYIPQLEEQIKNAVVGNVGTIASFRVGADDAEFLEKQFSPEFSKHDLVNLDNFNAILKMIINNKISTPFRMETILPKKGDYDIIQPLRDLSQLKYGKPKEIVEKEIIERSKLGAL